MERINDEQMEMINGGGFAQTASESALLKKAGLMDESYDKFELMFKWISGSAKVDAAWAKAGITCVTKPCKKNQYFYEGKEISRDEAIEMIWDKYLR